MASAADALPTEILEQVFQHFQNYYRRGSQNDEPSRRDRVDTPRFFSAPFMPPLRFETRQFARLRLVSWAWKGVVDTYIFKDVVIAIDARQIRSAKDYGAGYRCLDNIVRGGYTDLIRNIHLRLELFNNAFRDDALANTGRGVDILAYITLSCDLLVQPSKSRRRVFIELSTTNYADDKFCGGIADKMMNVMRK